MAQERNGSISKLVIEYPSTNRLTYDASSAESNTDEDAGDEDEPPSSGLQQQQKTRRKSELSLTVPAGRKGSANSRPPPPVQIRRSSSLTARLRDTFLPTTDYDIATPASAMYQPIDEETDSNEGDSAGEEDPEDMSFWKRNRGLFLIAISQLFYAMVWLELDQIRLLTVQDESLRQNTFLDKPTGRAVAAHICPNVNNMYVQLTLLNLTSSLGLSCVAYMYYKKTPHYLIGPSGVRLLLVARGFTGFFGLFGVYYSLQYLTLADATALTFLAPVITGFFGYIFLREIFTRVEALAGLISFTGVLLIARPTSLFGDSSDGGLGPQASPHQRLVAVGVALIGALGAAGAYIVIRAIGTRAYALISVSYYSIMATIASIIGMIIFRSDMYFPSSAKQILLLLNIGISGFFAQFLLTVGLQKEKAGRGTTAVYLQMGFAFFFEWLVWDVTPSFLSLAGTSLIIGGAIWVAVSKFSLSAGQSRSHSAGSTYVAIADLESGTGKDEAVEMTPQKIVPAAAEAGPPASPELFDIADNEDDVKGNA